ncbi:NADH-quinone oxidoreductase subunit C [Streptomyces sp. NPDC023723]|uniref:NADH-quinone oxidoreductase subunit C n=1 Tax=Streptomyces sp. NPDC023723 TaxID=3154323 RepID=UPI0033EE299D
MSGVGWLPADAAELFGPEATAEESYDVLTVDVPPADWITALRTARDRLGCTYFDWLSAVDEPGTGFRVAAHVAALSPVRRLLLRTTVPHETAVLPTAVDVYAGAAWHERETHEMFGVVFEGHPGLDHLLLPETFEGNPLRKDFVLAARVAKAWPGAKEPGESSAGTGHAGPRRRQMLPPGVPDPNEWGPLKGQLPAAPARPARGPARPPGTTGDRPVRRTRSATEGSAGQVGADAGQAGADAGPTRAVRRSRTAAEGSASQAAPGSASPTPVRRSRTAAEGSASQAAPPAEPSPAPSAPSAPSGPPGETTVSRSGTEETGGSQDTSATPRSPDAPWHHARPAFDEPTAEPRRDPDDESPAPAPGPDADADADAAPDPELAPDADPDAAPDPGKGSAPGPDPGKGSAPDPDPGKGSAPARDPEPDQRSAPKNPPGGPQ